MRSIFRVLILLVVATASSFSFADYRPKVVVNYVANTNGQYYPDPAADCASAVGTHELSGPDANGAYTCEGYSGGNYFQVTYSPVKACPAGYADSGLSDPAKACVGNDTTPPSDCASKIGQTETVLLKCFQQQCPTGWTREGGFADCSVQISSIVWPTPATRSVNGCPAIRTNIDTLNIRLDAAEVVGNSNPIGALCNVTYTVTGEAPPAPTPENPANPDPNAVNPSDPVSPGTGTGGSTGAGAGSGNGGTGTGNTNGTGAGPNGNGTGTPGGSGRPCTPTATVPCTGSGIDCVPTITRPCTYTGNGSGDCIPTATQPCSNTGGSSTTACDATPVCTGDGIQCAQVIQTWKSVCEVNRSLTYLDPAAKEAADNQALQAENQVAAHQAQVDLQGQSLLQGFQASLNQSTSAQCIQDEHLQVLSASVTLPYNHLCEILGLIRTLLLLSAYVYAARIIFGAL